MAKKCKICLAGRAEKEYDGRCRSCYRAKMASDEGTSYGKFVAAMHEFDPPMVLGDMEHHVDFIRPRKIKGDMLEYGYTPVQLTCGWCGKDFVGRQHTKYCCDACRASAAADNRHNRLHNNYVMVSCVICGKSFRKYGTAKTCSPECAAELHQQTQYACMKRKRDEMRPVIKCAVCGKEFVQKHKTITCSAECAAERKRYMQRLNKIAKEIKNGKAQDDRDV